MNGREINLELDAIGAEAEKRPEEDDIDDHEKEGELDDEKEDVEDDEKEDVEDDEEGDIQSSVNDGKRVGINDLEDHEDDRRYR
eukprot:Nk52_evm1s250 gene=Nk52_evmTU1s250